MTTKRLLLMVLVMIFITPVINAQDKEKEGDKKLVLIPYGFVKGDMFYSTAEVTSFGVLSLAAPQLATGGEQSAIGFTAQHSRLGLRGSVGEKIKAGGLIEMDFFTNAFDANGKPRIRLGYASVSKGGFEARLGQQWDLFSPNNAFTNNTNGNMWFAGNRGFRRAQIQMSYKYDLGDFVPMIQASVGEGARDNEGLGKDNLSGIPMIQARVSGLIYKKYTIGVSYVQAGFLEKKGSNIVIQDSTWILPSDYTATTTGIGIDFNAPVHKYFALSGEFNIGTNLNNANLFNIAGNYSFKDVAGKASLVNKESIGLWFNARSQVTDWMRVVVGYGFDQNTTEGLADGSLEKNSVIYGNLTFPVKHGFSVAVEFQNITGKRINADDLVANIISLSASVSF